MSGQLRSAGWDEITLHRFDQPFTFGHSLEQAVEMNLALGPAAEALRLAGDQGDLVRPKLEKLLRDALAQFVQDDGRVEAMSSIWVVRREPDVLETSSGGPDSSPRRSTRARYETS